MANEKYYVSLLQPKGLETLAQEAGTSFIDEPHVTLFPVVYDSPYEYEVPVREALVESIQFIRSAMGSMTANISEAIKFNNGTYGFRLDFSEEGKETLQNVADFLKRKEMIPVAAVGDKFDQQKGNLHMGLLQGIGDVDINHPAYRRLVSAIRKYIGKPVSFGNVRFDPRMASMQKVSLASIGAESYREHLRSWSDEDLISNFLSGLKDKGVDELGRDTTAGDLMYDEWMIRRGHYNDVSGLNAVASSDSTISYNTHLQRIASARIVESADDGALFR